MPEAPVTTPVTTPERNRQHRALGLLALAALACLVRLAIPVGIGLFLGMLLAFTLEPLYARLRKRDLKAGPAALVCALGAAVTITATAIALSTLLVSRGIALVSVVRDQLAPGGTLRAMADGATVRLAALHVDVSNLSSRIESEVLSFGSRIAGIAAAVAGDTFGGLLTLFFMTMATYVVLRHWTAIVTRAEQLLPFERRHTHALLDQFRTVGRQVLLGTVVTGLVQGLFAALGYWMTGVPEPAFFGALTALASLVPGVGTLLVWLTLGVVLLLTGHPGAGITEIVYSALTVGVVSDYVIRPRLVGSDKGVPPIVMFVALFGGVEVFGITGLILGPVLATLSLAILETYAREVDGESAAAPASRSGP